MMMMAMEYVIMMRLLVVLIVLRVIMIQLQRMKMALVITMIWDVVAIRQHQKQVMIVMEIVFLTQIMMVYVMN